VAPAAPQTPEQAEEVAGPQLLDRGWNRHVLLPVQAPFGIAHLPRFRVMFPRHPSTHQNQGRSEPLHEGGCRLFLAASQRQGVELSSRFDFSGK